MKVANLTITPYAIRGADTFESEPVVAEATTTLLGAGVVQIAGFDALVGDSAYQMPNLQPLGDGLIASSKKRMRFSIELEGEGVEEAASELGSAIARTALRAPPPAPEDDYESSGEGDLFEPVDPVYFGVQTGAGVVFGGMSGYALGVLIKSAANSMGNPWISTFAAAAGVLGAGIGGLAGSDVIAKITRGSDGGLTAEIRSSGGRRFIA
jgi:hypothetical protein